jgi:hypothetical protein
LFSYVDLEARVRRDDPLRPIREIANAAPCEGRAPHGPQLPQGTRRRSHQRHSHPGGYNFGLLRWLAELSRALIAALFGAQACEPADGKKAGLHSACLSAGDNARIASRTTMGSGSAAARVVSPLQRVKASVSSGLN